MLKVNELLKATAAKLVCGRPETTCAGISIDTRTIKRGEAFVAVKGANFDGHSFIEEAIKKGANCIIKESRTKIRNTEEIAVIEVKDTQKALGDIARFQRKKFDIPVIAVTGSNGKTTTKEMLAWVLSKKFKVLKNEGTKNNQIGIPLTLFNLDSSYDLAVLELGTNHFGEIEYLTGICKPNIGIITNIAPSHLKYFHDLAGVFEEKYKLIENLDKPYIGILNADDGFLRKKLISASRRPMNFSFGVNHAADFHGTQIEDIHGRWNFRVNDKYKFTLSSLGYYNIYNALAAISVARFFGMEHREIALMLERFDFPKGRLRVRKLNNIRFIDDSYNSNPLSLEYALRVLEDYGAKGRKIFLMGDMLELGKNQKLFHRKAAKRISQICDVFIGVGSLVKSTAQEIRAKGFSPKGIFICKNSRQARDILFSRVLPKVDDIILVKGSRLMRMEEVLTAK